MEQCPNCSTPARQGAKFCTTCGFRFDGGDSEPAATDTESGSTRDLPDIGNGQSSDERESGGWPPSPSPTPLAAQPSEGESHAAAPNVKEPDTEVAQVPEYGGFWPEPPSDPWAGPVTLSSEANERDDSGAEAPSQIAAASAAAAPSEDIERAAHARETIHALLDQVRDAIDVMSVGSPLDLSDVVSDLEVAVTPPGALPPDELAELREVLFDARERPRDIDTVVDLTRRIDALVALVIAYDRAIAAIERSLTALKRAEPPAEKFGPSPTAVGEGLG